MTKYILSAPGDQETTIEAKDLNDAANQALRFIDRYGLVEGPVYVYQEKATEPDTKVNIPYTNEPDPIYMFIYCASEHGSLSRRCKDDTAARKHAHILADAHGETCYISRYLGQMTGEGSRVKSIGQVEPRIPANFGMKR